MSSQERKDKEIARQFSTLLQEQTELSQKLAELEQDLNEHTVVIETLKKINDGERKCFRMFGGILAEQKLKNVLPQLSDQTEKIKDLIKNLNELYKKKSKEFSDFKEKHMIKTSVQSSQSNENQEENENNGPSNVLVS